jgi:propanediol dehydratase large subunit
MPRSYRFAALDRRPVNMDTFAQEWPEVGLVAADGPHDPQPSLRIEAGVVMELDGKQRADFDTIDLFIADHALDLEVAAGPWAARRVRWPTCWWTSTCHAPWWCTWCRASRRRA